MKKQHYYETKKNYNNYENFFIEMQNHMVKYYGLIRSYQIMAKGEESININENEMPNELLLLLEAFKNVKNIIINIEEAIHESIITYLLILLNNDWLFPCVFDLDLNFSCHKLNQEVMNVYKKKFNEFYGDFLNSGELTDIQIIEKILEKIEKEKEKNFKKDKISEKNKSNLKAEKEALRLKENKCKEFNEMLTKLYPNIIKNNNNIFEVLLLIIYSVKNYFLLID